MKHQITEEDENGFYTGGFLGAKTANEIAEIPKWRSGELLKDILGERDLMYEFGSEINEREIRNSFEKMNISMDMENWYKAETEAASLKQLFSGGSKELQRATFKLEMAVRKSDYEKARQEAENVKKILQAEWKRNE